MDSMLINAITAAYQREERVSLMLAANYVNPRLLSTLPFALTGKWNSI